MANYNVDVITKIMSRYRNEWKYECYEARALELGARLNALMSRDSYADSHGKYIIRSLYFDDYKNTSAVENVSGERERFKYRIRYYGNDVGYLKLEKKIKKNSLCRKEACPISIEQCKQFISGDVSSLVYDEGAPLIREFAMDILRRGFMPKVIIEYEREAYVEPITNVRITFDRNIISSEEVDKFLLPDEYIKRPFKDIGTCVLEVKFDDILPSYIRRVVEANCFTQQAHSKYYLGRRMCDIKL